MLKICNYINTTGVTSGTGTAYPSRAPEFTPIFLLAIVLSVLQLTDSYYLLPLWCLQSVLIKTYLKIDWKIPLAQHLDTSYLSANSLSFDLWIPITPFGIFKLFFNQLRSKNFTNINKTKNLFSPQLIEHDQTTIYDVWNLDPVLR